MKKLKVILVISTCAIISFCGFAVVTIYSSIFAIDDFLDGTNYYLAHFFSDFTDVFFFFYGVIINLFTISYFLFFVIKRLSFVKKNIIFLIVGFILFALFLMYLYTKSMLMDPSPYGDLEQIFGKIFSVIVIMGCVMSGFGILSVLQIVQLIKKRNN